MLPDIGRKVVMLAHSDSAQRDVGTQRAPVIVYAGGRIAALNRTASLAVAALDECSSFSLTAGDVEHAGSTKALLDTHTHTNTL